MVYGRVKIQAVGGDGGEEVDEDDGGGTDNGRHLLLLQQLSYVSAYTHTNFTYIIQFLSSLLSFIVRHISL